MKPDSIPEVVHSFSPGGSTVGKLMVLLLAVTLISTSVFAQSSAKATTPKTSVVPNLVRFSGIASDDGKPLNHIVGITFSLYQNQEGGFPLWVEMQNVLPDKNGHYSVSLGATKPEGVSPDLFASGQAQWLGVQIEGQAEQQRVLLLSVPYALKAADAETIGGLPPSAFVLATPSQYVSEPSSSSTTGSTNSSASAPPPGTTNFVPLWSSASNIGNSVLFQSGTGSSAKVGINTTAPGATLDIKGTANLQGLLTSAASGAATSTSGKSSQAHSFVASSFNSSTKTAVNQTFQWKAEPTANNTAAPSGTLNLLFGSGTSLPAETGLRVSNKGILTFAAGQTFPGAGTITGVTAGTGLTGGGTAGKVTLNLDTTKTPQLTAANSFTAPQSITNSAKADALTVTNNAGSGYGIVTTGNGGGVFAEANNVGATGVFGANVASTGNGVGVEAQGSTTGALPRPVCCGSGTRRALDNTRRPTDPVSTRMPSTSWQFDVPGTHTVTVTNGSLKALLVGPPLTTVCAGPVSVPAPSRLAPMSQTTTRAPSCANNSAMPRPIPRPAPVTIATLPATIFGIRNSPSSKESCHNASSPGLSRPSR